MSRIVIDDLPEDHKINKEEMRKVVGGTLEGKQYQMMQEMYDQGIEGQKSNYEEAKDQFSWALKIMQEVVDRRTQIIQKITS